MSFRQLVSIMFTDIVGYTALMGEDEQRAFALLRKNRQIQQPFIKTYGGTLIKEIGDGILATFPTASDAVACAIAIQQQCRQDEELKLRIGIHLGDVLFEDGDIFGDGVNIASRVQAMAPPGSLWITDPVHKIVSNNKNILATYAGEETLRNVKEPIKVYEVDINVEPIEPGQVDATAYRSANGPKRKIHEKSVAVLPFANFSNDPEQEYFGDGIAEEIINSLVHIRDLKVAGRMSSFQFKGVNTDLREVGQRLGVSTVLEGSIRRQGNRIRITAQLIDVESGFHLWSETFDRQMDDIFAIQDEIALAITKKLKITLAEGDRDRITRNHTQNAEAYELCLKGRFHINRRGTSILTGIHCFQQAIALDPEFAVAYTGIADACLLVATYGLAPPASIMPSAKSAALKAIELAPDLCEPYCSLGHYYTCYEWNWKEGERNFLKSLELNPSYVQAHYWFGWIFLSWIAGAFEEAIRYGRRAVKLEPLSAICHGHLSLIYNTAGRFDEGLASSRDGLELDPNSFICQMNEGSSLLALEHFEAAQEAYEKAAAISNRNPFAVCCMVCNHARAGHLTEAQSLLEELRSRAKKEYVANTFLGLSAAHVESADVAYEYLKQAAEMREPLFLALKNEHWLPEGVKQDPRIQELLQQVNYRRSKVSA